MILLAGAAWLLPAAHFAADLTPGVVWEFDTGG